MENEVSVNNSPVKISGVRMYLCVSGQELEGFLLPSDGTAEGASRIYVPFDGDRTDLLKSIENAVYDHPEILEDNPADIIIDTPSVLFFPSSLDADALDVLMDKIYGSDSGDYFVRDEGDGISSAFTLCNRLKGFIDRTFPGLPVRNQFSPLIQKYSAKGSGRRLYAVLGKNKVDIMCFAGRRLLNASSHVAALPEDMAYYICMVWNQYGLNPQEDEVFIGGDKAMREKIVPVLRQFIHFVRHTPGPTLPFEFTLSEAVSVLYRQKA